MHFTTFLSAFVFNWIVCSVEGSTNRTVSRNIDVAIVFDVSISMTKSENLEALKRYLSKVVNLFDTEGENEPRVQVSLLGFTTRPFILCNYTSCKDVKQTETVIRNMTAYEEALDANAMMAYVANEAFQSEFGARENSKNVTKVSIAILHSPPLLFSHWITVAQRILNEKSINFYLVTTESNGIRVPSFMTQVLVVKRFQDLPGFYGLHDALKEKYGPKKCAKNPCLNNGTCTEISFSPYFKCKCLAWYTGPLCELVGAIPCSSNKCNGFTCTQISSTTHNCSCPVYCSSKNCSGCRQISPCSSNPCLNDCECVESAFDGGFRCIGDAGNPDKLCGIAKSDIECESSRITVKISENVVKQYEAGVPNTQVYLSPKFKGTPRCAAHYDPSLHKFVISVPFPFTGCGTVKVVDGVTSEFHNTVWLNRVSPIFDMPVPVLEFKCVYGNLHSVVSTYIKPHIGPIPVVTGYGKLRVSMKAYKNKPGREDRTEITSGSAYTTGQIVYLEITVEGNENSGVVVPKLVNCFASALPHSESRSVVNIVTDGCPNKDTGTVIYPPTSKPPTVNVGFRTFRLAFSESVYYNCSVSLCKITERNCLASKSCSSRRKKRSEVEPSLKSLQVGPIVIVADPKEMNKSKDEDMTSRSRIPLLQLVVILLSTFTFLVVVSAVAFCILLRLKSCQRLCV